MKAPLRLLLLAQTEERHPDVLCEMALRDIRGQA
jgi:hypothetical protein